MKLFDAHLHIIDPRFPLVPNNNYLPDTFTCSDYLKRMENYNLCGGAVVSGSFQGFDDSYLLDALATLGPGYVGVINLPATVSDQKIMELDTAGVRAVRFNLMRGGSEKIEQLESMSQRVYELCGWHVELYVQSGELDGLYKTLVRLPALSIDHLGLSEDGFVSLLKLVEKGTHIKASGFGRIDFDFISAIKRIYSLNPAALMFATDLPSTRAPRAYSDNDFNLIVDSFTKDEAKNIFYNNAIAFYKPKGFQSLCD